MELPDLATELSSPLWSAIAKLILPQCRPGSHARAWCHGPGAAGEAHKLALLSAGIPAASDLEILVTGEPTDAGLLDRARGGRVSGGGGEALAPDLRKLLRRGADGEFTLREPLQQRITVATLAIALEPWPRELELMVLRGAIFLGAADDKLARAAEQAMRSLRSHAWLVIGESDAWPKRGAGWFTHPDPAQPIHRRLH